MLSQSYNNRLIILLYFTISFVALLSVYSSASNFNQFWIFIKIIRTIGVIIVLIHISWFLAQKLHNLFEEKFVSTKNRVILITGCDTGFAHNICYKLDKLGFHIIAGVLYPDSKGANQLKTYCSERVNVIKLDVTQEKDILNAVKVIENSGLQLWALLNSAGISYYSMIEMGISIEELEKTFAVNVFGLVKVTKYCLPLLRKSCGRVINIASLSGRFSTSGLSHYCMSKFCVRAFSDCLRREMFRFGVKVITIEPYLYRTPINDINIQNKLIDQIWSNTQNDVRIDYGGNGFLDKLKLRFKYSLQMARIDTNEVVDCLEKAIILRNPDIYYRCAGIHEKLSFWLLEQVSDLGQDFILTGHVMKTIMCLFNKNNVNFK